MAQKNDLLDPCQSNRERIPDETEKTLSQPFYVNDFLASEPTQHAALDLINEGIARFERYDLKLCKVQSNAEMVRQAYPSSKPPPTTVNLAPIDPSSTEPSDGASLGLQWDLQDDVFNIKTDKVYFNHLSAGNFN